MSKLEPEQKEKYLNEITSLLEDKYSPLVINEFNDFESDDRSLGILIYGLSGSGKDAVIDLFLESNSERFAKVKTGTSRPPRLRFKRGTTQQKKDLVYDSLKDMYEPHEKNEYLRSIQDLLTADSENHESINFFREQKVEESNEEYRDNIIKEYELVEHDFHHGNLYGMPLQSLTEVIEEGKVPIIRMEPSGGDQVQEKLKSQFNFFVIGFVPDSAEMIRKSIDKRENPEERYKNIIEWLKVFPKVTNTTLVNKYGKIDDTIRIFGNILNKL